MYFFALEPVEETLYAVEIVFGVAFEDQAALLGGELTPGNVCGDAALARPFARFLEKDAVARFGPRLDGAIIERLAGVGYDEVEIEIDGVAEALAARASAIGIVEGKEPRLGLLVERAVVFALEALIEGEALGGRAGGIGGKFEDGFAAALAVADFNGIDEARARLRVGGKAVDKNVDGLGEIDVQERFRRGEFVDAAFLVEPVEAALLEILQHQAQGSLRAEGRQPFSGKTFSAPRVVRDWARARDRARRSVGPVHGRARDRQSGRANRGELRRRT